MMNDLMLERLKRLATTGERGPHYDRGVMSVFAEVQSNGFFVPSPIAKQMHGLHQPAIWDMLDDDEKSAANNEAKRLGMTIEQASQYYGGVRYAHTFLPHLNRGDE